MHVESLPGVGPAARKKRAMAHFYFRLNGPRPTFPGDITDDERRTMEAHVAYTQTELEAGRVLAYGPVFAAGGGFGIALLDVDDEAAARRFGEGDPSVASGLMTYEVWPMRVFGTFGKVTS